jgi:hypothetical protein
MRCAVHPVNDQSLVARRHAVGHHAGRANLEGRTSAAGAGRASAAGAPGMAGVYLLLNRMT